MKFVPPDDGIPYFHGAKGNQNQPKIRFLFKDQELCQMLEKAFFNGSFMSMEVSRVICHE